MPNKKFKQCGAIILESKEGDIMIADPSLKSDIVIRREIIALATEDGEKAQILANQFAKFFIYHRHERWLRVANDLVVIKEEDPDFVSRMRKYTEDRTVENLRKLEKDVWFWKRDNGKLEINVGKK